jgi:hypothetical protein
VKYAKIEIRGNDYIHFSVSDMLGWVGINQQLILIHTTHKPDEKFKHNPDKLILKKFTTENEQV